ncbi:MAG TPA: hypothetical protein VJR23_00675 [Candidatus Acidoferrales bacterium]|nr:hypothetical protein [Candidatus Acidoferrales bacterium]
MRKLGILAAVLCVMLVPAAFGQGGSQEQSQTPANAPANAQPAAAQENAAKRMTNQDVISMVSAGLSADIIIAKIRAANSGEGLNFDTSVDALKSLKAANVPDSVVEVMINPTPAPTVVAASAPMTMDPNLPPPEVGVYWRDGHSFDLIPGFALTNEKVGGRAGAIFTDGFRGQHWDATIDGPTSKNIVKDRHPTFYIYVPDGNSAADYVLVSLNKKEDHREFQVGSFGGFTQGKSGVKKDKQVPFTAEHVGIRTYKITLQNDLKPGEYAFFMGTGNTASMAETLGAARSGGNALGRVYDFSVPQ